MCVRVCVCDRQKLSGAREEVIEEQQAQVLEDVPLRAVHSLTVTPRHAQPFKYTRHMVPMATASIVQEFVVN